MSPFNLGKGKSGLELRLSCPFLEPVEPYVDPATAYTPIGWNVVYNVYERLIERNVDRSGRISYVPALAESWDVSPDNLRFRFRLRRKARFASGVPVNSEAVEFSFLRLITMGEKHPESIPIARASSRYVPLKGLNVLGSHEIELLMKERWATTMLGLSSAICSVVDGSQVKTGDDLGHEWLARRSAGSGPYRIERVSRHRVILARNENYWGRRPHVQRVVLVDGDDPSKEKLRLSRGTVDGSTSVAPSDLAGLALAGFETSRVPSFLLPTLTVTEPTTGPDGRSLAENRGFVSAMKYALDYDAIADSFGGWGDGVEPAQTSVLKGMPGYDVQLANYFRRRVRKARDFLVEAGYPGGLTVPLTFWRANWGGVDNIEIVRIVRSSLAEVGINTEVKGFTGKEYFELSVEKQPGITLSMSGYVVPDPDDLTRRRMTWINVSGHDFRAETEFQEALKEANGRSRSLRYKDLQRRFLDEGAGIYLLTFPVNLAFGPRVVTYGHPVHWGGPDFSKFELKTEPITSQ